MWGARTLGWKLGVLGSSLTSVTYLLYDLWESHLFCLDFSLFSCKMHSCGPVTSPSRSFHLVTLPASRFGSEPGPSPSPRLACLPHPPFQRNTLPLSCPSTGLAGAGLPRTGGGETIPAVQASAVRAGPRPVTIGPEIQRDVCLGDPRFHLNLLSLWPTASLFSPPSLVAVPAPALLRSGMYMFHRPKQPLYRLGNLTKGCRVAAVRVATVRVEGGDSRGAGKTLDRAAGQ